MSDSDSISTTVDELADEWGLHEHRVRSGAHQLSSVAIAGKMIETDTDGLRDLRRAARNWGA
jgi:hypothetical protein